MMSKLESNQPLVIDLLVEGTGNLGCLVHIPTLPGLNFRVENASKLEGTTLYRIPKYP